MDMNGHELSQLSPKELFRIQDELTERELELLEEIYKARNAADRYERKYEREILKTRNLQRELTEAKSGLRVPEWLQG